MNNQPKVHLESLLEHATSLMDTQHKTASNTDYADKLENARWLPPPHSSILPIFVNPEDTLWIAKEKLHPANKAMAKYGENALISSLDSLASIGEREPGMT